MLTVVRSAHPLLYDLLKGIYVCIRDPHISPFEQKCHPNHPFYLPAKSTSKHFPRVANGPALQAFLVAFVMTVAFIFLSS